MFNGCEVIGATCRLLCAVMQLPERDARNAELLGQRIEFLPQGLRIILHHIDADIGVEHVSQHQSGSRSSVVSCLRSAMKSSLACGPLSNKSSHRLPCGAITRLRPIFKIST